MSDKPTVFVVDDDELTRESVCALVSSMGYAAQPFASGEEFLAFYQEERPGCLVSDLRMQGMSGVELLETLTRRGFHLPVVMITAYARTPTTVRAMKAGAVTLIDKPYSDNELWDAIRTALVQGAEHWVQSRRISAIRERLASLTEEQRRVLELLVAGKPNKTIASSLGIGLRTAESRRAEILTILQVDSLAQLVQMVVEAKLSPP
jgi:FixJ family two-component response regulator